MYKICTFLSSLINIIQSSDILTETLVLQSLVESFTFKTHKMSNLCLFSLSCYFSSDTGTKTDDAGGIPCDDSVSSLIEVRLQNFNILILVLGLKKVA